MSYEFFLSYARADQDEYLHQFLRDLNSEVCAGLGVRQGSRVGFFDEREIELGDHWDSQIVHALRTSKVMVCLYSGAYFGQPYCGKEWALFHLRRKTTQAVHGCLPPVILPVLWKPPTLSQNREPKVPPLPTGIDGAVAEVQYTYGTEQAVYNINGLRFALYQKNRYETDYKDYVYQLAMRIIQTGKEQPLLDIPEIPSLATVVPAFPSSTQNCRCAVSCQARHNGTSPCPLRNSGCRSERLRQCTRTKRLLGYWRRRLEAILPGANGRARSLCAKYSLKR